MRRISIAMWWWVLLLPALAWGASQDRYPLPEPYLGWERQYLAEFSDLQKLMDVMIATSARQLKDPSQDVLHNRVCAALAQRMAHDMGLPAGDRRLAIATDLLHNISKEERPLVLTDAAVLRQGADLVARLRKAGHLQASPAFWTDEAVLAMPGVGGNLSLIHHITGAVTAGGILREAGGYSDEDRARVEAAIVGHSTGYWYFRKSVDDAAKQPEAWRKVYPEPEEAIAKIAHDADLISQFEAESVVPDGSKWRVLATKRWGAQGAVEEAHVVYYVFSRLFDEARTDAGKALAMDEWRKIAPELVRLMGLPPQADPIKTLGVPRAFR